MRQEILHQLSQITAEEQWILDGNPVDLTVYNRLGHPVMQPGKLLPGGELFGIRLHTRFVDFPWHSHEYVEMVYQVQGQTTHLLSARQPLVLTAGKLLLLGRGTQHAIAAAGRHDLAVNFILIPAFFDGAAISLGGSNALSVFLKSNLQNRKLSSGHLLFDVSDAPMLQNLLENLILGQFQGVKLELQRLTLELLLQHLSTMTESLIVGTKADQEQAIVLDLLAKLERNVKLNLSEAAKAQNLDVSYLSRLVKKYTGCSFMELLHTARFNRAVAMLRDTDVSVADIAAAIGYENTAFFYRRFAEKYGCTPAEYRRRLRA